MNGSSMNISKTNIELSLGTTESDGFFSFETIELAPGQVIWLQNQEGQDYRIRVGEGLGANNFNAEIRGDDVFVHAPNGGTIVLRQYASNNPQIISRADHLEEHLLISDEEDAKDEPMISQDAGLEEDSSLDREEKAKESQVKENTATDGETYTQQTSTAEMDSAAGQSGTGQAVASQDDDDDDAAPFWLWGGLGLLSTAGVAYALDDDNDSVAAPTFAGGNDATASIAENSDVTDVVYQAEATTADNPDSTITYSLSGPDASSFTIDADTGEVRLIETADHEVRETYDITVIATNSEGSSASQQLEVSVTDVTMVVEGRVLAGPVVPEHGLSVEIYNAAGVRIATAEVDEDGYYRAELPDDHMGPTLVRVIDADSGDDYLHEGSGEPEDLAADLRAVDYVTDFGMTLTININPLTEIATRRLLNDDGGDDGHASTQLASDMDAEDIEQAKADVAQAFGLEPEVDIDGHATTAVNEPDYDSASAETQAMANVLAAIAAAEVASDESPMSVMDILTDGIIDDADGNRLHPVAHQLLVAGAMMADDVEGNAGDATSNIIDDIPLIESQEAAVEKIDTYNTSDGASAEPTVGDYDDAYVTGVTANNLEAVNARVLADDEEGTDTVVEIQHLVTEVNALALIEAYNNGDGTTPPPPTVDDYADAGISGVTDDNVDDVNARVLSQDPGGADTVPDVQNLVDSINALATIEAYNNGDGTTPPPPTVDDYADAGISGVTDDTLDDVNARVLSQDPGGADTVPEVQNLVDSINALALIEAYNKGDGTTPPPPTVDDYADAGISGVTDDTLDDVNARVLSQDPGGADTVPEVQNLVDSINALALIEAYNNGDGTTPPPPTVDDYADAGISGVTDDTLDDVNARVLSQDPGGADTVPDVQNLVDSINALATIEAYNNGDGTTPPPPTVDDYADAGISGVTDDTLDDVNARVLSQDPGGVDTVPEVQNLVDAVNASQTVLDQIGAEGDNPDTTNSVVTVAQLNTISPALTDVDPAHEALYQDYIDANPDQFTDGTATQLEVQAMVDAVNAAAAAVPTAPTVDALTTSDTTPTITGMATLAVGETLTVVVNGATYDNVAVTAGVWSIDTSTAMPDSGVLGAFADGSYDVVATVIVTDAATNTAVDTTTNEITIDTTDPAAPTVDALTTSDTTPTITGTATLAAGESLTVVVNGATYDNGRPMTTSP
jgi:hypothetical protein